MSKDILYCMREPYILSLRRMQERILDVIDAEDHTPKVTKLLNELLRGINLLI